MSIFRKTELYTCRVCTEREREGGWRSRRAGEFGRCRTLSYSQTFFTRWRERHTERKLIPCSLCKSCTNIYRRYLSTYVRPSYFYSILTVLIFCRPVRSEQIYTYKTTQPSNKALSLRERAT